MIRILLVLGGCAGRPSARLDGKTPLEFARTVHLDELAASGRVGSVGTIPAGLAATEENALLTLLGVASEARTDAGGGPFEALGFGATLEPGDVAYRLSFVTTLDDALVDPTAGGIDTAEARVLLDAIARDAGLGDAVRFVPGRSEAHALVVPGAESVATTHAPGAILGRPVEPHRPTGPGSDVLNRLLDRAPAVLREHEVNRVRVDLGENPANFLWPWGGGRLVELPRFGGPDGSSCACVTSSPLVAGLAAAAGFADAGLREVDPDAESVRVAIREHDLVLVHRDGLRRAADSGDVRAWVRAIEALDEELIGPLVAGLERLGTPWRLLAVADVLRGGAEGPTADPVPFLLAGEGARSVRRISFDESGAASADLKVDEGNLLADYLLAGRESTPGTSEG